MLSFAPNIRIFLHARPTDSPQFFFRLAEVTAVTRPLGDIDMCVPGEAVKLAVNLMRPVALDTGSRFAIREGGRTVGSGVVSKVVR